MKMITGLLNYFVCHSNFQTANAILLILHGKQHTVCNLQKEHGFLYLLKNITLTVFNMIISAKFWQIYFVT